MAEGVRHPRKTGHVYGLREPIRWIEAKAMTTPHHMSRTLRGGVG